MKWLGKIWADIKKINWLKMLYFWFTGRIKSGNITVKPKLIFRTEELEDSVKVEYEKGTTIDVFEKDEWANIKRIQYWGGFGKAWLTIWTAASFTIMSIVMMVDNVGWIYDAWNWVVNIF